MRHLMGEELASIPRINLLVVQNGLLPFFLEVVEYQTLDLARELHETWERSCKNDRNGSGADNFVLESRVSHVFDKIGSAAYIGGLPLRLKVLHDVMKLHDPRIDAPESLVLKAWELQSKRVSRLTWQRVSLHT